MHLSPLMLAKASFVGGAVAVALASLVTGRPVKPGRDHDSDAAAAAAGGVSA